MNPTRENSSNDPVRRLLDKIELPEVSDEQVKRVAVIVQAATQSLRAEDTRPTSANESRFPIRSAFLARLSRWPIAAMIALLLIGSSGVGAAAYFAVRAIWGEPKTTTATFAELEWEPATIEQSTNGDSAYLVGRNKRPLIVWQTVPGGVEDTAFVSKLESGKGPLAIVGYSSIPRNPFPGSFLAYSAKLGDGGAKLPEMLWTLSMERLYLPEDVRELFAGRDVGPQLSARRCRVLDVFPEVEGPELVFIFQHTSTISVVLIADLDGKVRYTITHDGNLLDAAWIEQPGLLVFSGLSGDALRGERGLTPEGDRHPAIVFAIQPILDDVQAKWVQSETHVGVMPAFYRYVDNSAVVQHESHVTLGTPHTSLDSMQYLGVVVHAQTPLGDAAVTLSMDAAGNEVPGKRQRSNTWNLEEKSGFLQSHELIQLKELPPIQNREESGNPKLPADSSAGTLHGPTACIAHPQCRGWG